jgi:glucosamine--fructose-6-phosphate aminotransferase (isomerizing)
MNRTDPKYKEFYLVKEMMEAPEIIRNFDRGQAHETSRDIAGAGKLFMTGEGSSRIFPAKNAMALAMRHGLDLEIRTDGSRQAHEYDLRDYSVFGASNSGRTKEIISLFSRLKDWGHSKRYGLTANEGTKLEELSNKCYILSCGKEDAVAATKSVVEQALFYQALLGGIAKDRIPRGDLDAVAGMAVQVLEAKLDADIVRAIADANVIYFAGRNDGVAEELTLKTNEITRKKSAFLEGTYAVHGVEEVMDPEDVVVVVDPFPAEVDKFKEVLVDGVGLKVFAISTEETIFPTIQIPGVPDYDTYLQLLAGWNVLVEVGVANGINLDKPERARKVGNEFIV